MCSRRRDRRRSSPCVLPVHVGVAARTAMVAAAPTACWPTGPAPRLATARMPTGRRIEPPTASCRRDGRKPATAQWALAKRSTVGRPVRSACPPGEKPRAVRIKPPVASVNTDRRRAVDHFNTLASSARRARARAALRGRPAPAGAARASRVPPIDRVMARRPDAAQQGLFNDAVLVRSSDDPDCGRPARWSIAAGRAGRHRRGAVDLRRPTS